MQEDRPIIIIKKKGGHAGGHHGGAWKVAYADFVTAMMAFFLVMWILGLSPKVRQSIAQYFKDPFGVMKADGGRQLMGMGLSIKGSSHDANSLNKLLKDNDAARLMKARDALNQKLSNIQEFKSIKDNVEITLTPEGLRIELLEGSQGVFFETGSAALKPKTVDLLHVIGKELGRLPNPVVMEGHTDSRPYAGGLSGYSNWELSTDRANSARRTMVGYLRPTQVAEVRGYAATHLRVPSNPMHYSNRRISILVPFASNSDLMPKGALGVQAAAPPPVERAQVAPDLKGEYDGKGKEDASASDGPHE